MGIKFPSTDSGLVSWSANFSDRINLAPVPLGLTALQASAYQTLHESFVEKVLACEPGSRSHSAVLAKDGVRTDLKNQARLLANIIDGQASVSNEEKALLGLTVRSQPQPIPPPAFAPAVDIDAVNGTNVSIRIHDSQTSRRGRPAGVKGAAIFTAIGPTAPVTSDGWTFQANTSETKVVVGFPETTPALTRVWFRVFWFNYRMLSGPPCAAVSTLLLGNVEEAAG